MGYFLVFLIIVIISYKFAKSIQNNGFKNLDVYRESKNRCVTEGENFEITIVLENKKKKPLSFVLVTEKIPIEVFNREYDNVTQYHLEGYQRIKKTYIIPTSKRGVYLFKEIKVVIGDIFGFFTVEKKIEDYLEFVIYPKVKNMNNLKFESTSQQGDSIIKRWIFKDPLSVKGIREYAYGDRMKDIHWKSTLKMNKLMVKEYDFTSEKEFVTILNVQCGKTYWICSNKSSVDKGVDVALSISDSAIKQGIKTALWTNATIRNYSNKSIKGMTISSMSLKPILELCARMYYMPKLSFSDFLKQQLSKFKPNKTYVIVTSFLSKEDVNLLLGLKNNGISLKIIDVSNDENLPSIRGIEKLKYRGERF